MTLILIHGAWAGAWVWDALATELEACGHRVICLDLPGDGTHPIPPEATTTADLHDALSTAIDSVDGPVVLVGHSGGGMLVTAGAERFPERVSHGIWIAGMLIPDGRSFDDIQTAIVGPGETFGVTAQVQSSDCGRYSVVPRQAAIDYFLQDASPEQQQYAADRFTAQPAAGRRLLTPTTAAFEKLPKLYVLTTEDRSVIPAAQRAMAGSTSQVCVAEIETGHVPQLICPDVLAGLIDRWLAAS